MLLLLPRLGAGLVSSAKERAPDGSRRAALMNELSAGLAVARETPSLYVAAVAGSLVFTALHVATLVLLVRAVGGSASWGSLAFASLTSTFLAAVIPSPAGTFGPMESGFAAGLAADGVRLSDGVELAAYLHASTAVFAGIFGLGLLWRVYRPSPISSNAAQR